MSDLPENSLLRDLRQLIDSSRRRVAVAVNSELVLLYWHMGTRIRSDILKEERAEYGKRIVGQLVKRPEAVIRRDLDAMRGDAYTNDEVKELAEVVYLHVYEQYEAAANTVYSDAGTGVLA